jgi:hypothetical protein
MTVNHAVVRLTSAAVVAALAAVLPQAGVAQATGPTVTRSVVVEETLSPDEFVLAVCGIEVDTVVTERTVTMEWPDGRLRHHVVVTYVPADERLAVERDAFTDTFAADGTRTTVGLPIRLIDQTTGRIVIRDAGRIIFTDDGLDIHGPHPYAVSTDIAPYYCPGLFPSP